MKRQWVKLRELSNTCWDPAPWKSLVSSSSQTNYLCLFSPPSTHSKLVLCVWAENKLHINTEYTHTHIHKTREKSKALCHFHSSLSLFTADTLIHANSSKLTATRWKREDKDGHHNTVSACVQWTVTKYSHHDDASEHLEFQKGCYVFMTFICEGDY